MRLNTSTIEKLKQVPDNTIIGAAIAVGIRKDVVATVKMIWDQIRDNKRLVAEVIGDDLVREISDAMIRSLRSLKQGTKFKWYDKDDKMIVAIAKQKRAGSREVEFEGVEGTYTINSNTRVELL